MLWGQRLASLAFSFCLPLLSQPHSYKSAVPRHPEGLRLRAAASGDTDLWLVLWLLEAKPKVLYTAVEALPVLQFPSGHQGLLPSQQMPQVLMAGVGDEQGPPCSGFNLGGRVLVAV